MQNTRHKPKDFWRLDSISTSCWAKEQICKSETLHTPFPSVSLSSYSSFYSVVLDCLHFRIFTAGDDEPSNIQGGERQTCGRRLSQRFSSVQYSDSCVARPWTYGCSIHLSNTQRCFLQCKQTFGNAWCAMGEVQGCRLFLNWRCGMELSWIVTLLDFAALAGRMWEASMQLWTPGPQICDQVNCRCRGWGIWRMSKHYRITIKNTFEVWSSVCVSEVVGMDERKVKRSHSIAWHKSDCPDSHKGGACKVRKRADRWQSREIGVSKEPRIQKEAAYQSHFIVFSVFSETSFYTLFWGYGSQKPLHVALAVTKTACRTSLL